MDTREKIIVSAGEQFMKYGIRSVTMDDIARLAGVSKKTVYQEFADKNQLVLFVFKQELENDQCRIDELPANSEEVIDHLIKLSNYLRKRFSEMNPFILNEIQRYYPECWQLFEEFKTKHIHAEIKEILEKGVDAGYFRPEINIEIITAMRIEQMTSLFDPVKFPPSVYDMGQLHMEVFEHFIFGLFTEKGKNTYLKKKTNQQ
ncbi:TetR/AcrR family transcriptional regulator [Belliella kenyensis]|uniref:TetR/AcrR family transcriptional regulator n=1 Tax=Belliella kenyensis TaxID=1472724 RepID=A0ABV8ELZ0_9BACT|nr:TetR/AcrR family transcriptional regulator [Belliella kenyensis]MCH7400456.1 TetR/AcrR family transcriptional regulator [Belliella kenyensis]MDN3604528.1 TetR/AcrR family transcriptional regulator [Belliella kenyensis]